MRKTNSFEANSAFGEPAMPPNPFSGKSHIPLTHGVLLTRLLTLYSSRLDRLATAMDQVGCAVPAVALSNAIVAEHLRRE
jgi:hypothetical protein